MLREDVDRLIINKDEAWETSFIPWLEIQERNNVGVEDGVFVATISPELRFLQPDKEDDFVKNCAQNHLSSTVIQKLKEFTTKGLYHFGTESASEKDFEKFKEVASELSSYKKGTCCSQILNQENGLQKLFNHFHSDVIRENVKKCVVKSTENTRSLVLLEERGLKLSEAYKNYEKNTKGFKWEASLKVRPKKCPDLECHELSDSEESYFSDDEMGYSIPVNNSTEKNERDQKMEDENKSGIFYGYGFDCVSKDRKITANLNLNRIFNILWLLPYFYSGFHSSYLYFGMAHSVFPVHIEDALTWSLNYLHVGHPKIWIIIPPWATDLLDFHLQKGGLYLVHARCRNLLGHKVLLPTIEWLNERRIPFKIVVQRPGDLLVLYPNAAHFGFNLGPNIAEAINIGTKSWIPWGLNALKCTCFGAKQIHLNMMPLIAAFRKDLLYKTLNGDIVVTPQSVRGRKLLHQEIARINADEQHKSAYEREHTKKRKNLKDNNETVGLSSNNKSYEERTDVGRIQCPAKQCKKTFSNTDVTKCRKDMMKHVTKAHKPILQKSCLRKKVEQQFNVKKEVETSN